MVLKLNLIMIIYATQNNNNNNLIKKYCTKNYSKVVFSDNTFFKLENDICISTEIPKTNIIPANTSKTFILNKNLTSSIQKNCEKNIKIKYQKEDLREDESVINENNLFKNDDDSFKNCNISNTIIENISHLKNIKAHSSETIYNFDKLNDKILEKNKHLEQTQVLISKINENNQELNLKQSKRMYQNKILPNSNVVQKKSNNILHECIHLSSQQTNLLRDSIIDTKKFKSIAFQIFSLLKFQIDTKKNYNKNKLPQITFIQSISMPITNQKYNSHKAEKINYSNSNKTRPYCIDNFNYLNSYNHVDNIKTCFVTPKTNIKLFDQDNSLKNQELTIISNNIQSIPQSNLFTVPFLNSHNSNNERKLDGNEIKINKEILNKPQKYYVKENHDIQKTKITKNTQTPKNNDISYNNQLGKTNNTKDEVNSQIKKHIDYSNYGLLSSGENENEEAFIEEEENGKIEVISSDSDEEYKLDKLIKSTYTIKKLGLDPILIKTYNFYTDFLIKTKDSDNDIRHFPEGFSFSPGWHHFRLSKRAIFYNKLKIYILRNICKYYNLENYFSLIYTMIRNNTFTYANHFISIELCFHLICYHLCTKWNLGKGLNITISNHFSYRNLINYKNFKRLFKTHEQWFNRAVFLLNHAKKTTNFFFGTAESSFTATNLFNLMLLIPGHNSKRIAFICFVYHISNLENLFTYLHNKFNNNLSEINQKKKILSKIPKEYRCYITKAKQNLRFRYKTIQNNSESN